MTSTAPPKPPRRRTWTGAVLRLFLLLVLLLIALLVWLPVLLPYALQQHGIQLQWQQPRWSWHTVELEQLQLEYDGQRLEARDVKLGWLWQKYPLQLLDVGQLSIHAKIPEQDNETSEPAPDLFALAQWLPHQLNIHQFNANIVDMAQVSGQILLQADADNTLLQPSQLEIDLTLTHLHPDWLSSIPAELQPDSLRIRTLTHPDTSAKPEALQVLALDVHSLGKSHIQLSGILSLMNTPNWHGELEQARLHLDLPQLQLDGIQAQKLQAQLQFSAHANEQRFTLQLEQPATLKVAQLQPDKDTLIVQTAITLDQLELTAGLQEHPVIDANARYQASIKQIKHPSLHTQSWNANGSITGKLPDLQASAAISNKNSLQ